jgi:hypothetical protein
MLNKLSRSSARIAATQSTLVHCPAAAFGKYLYLLISLK